jgi:hypothetical protein
MFKDCHEIIDDENGPQLILIVENHFKTIQHLNELKEKQDAQTSPLHHHRPSLVPLAKRNKLLTKLGQNPNELHFDEKHEHHDSSLKNHHHHLSFHTAASIISRTLTEYHHITHPTHLSHDDIMHIKESTEYKTKMHEYEERSMQLKPIVEGRILRVTDDKVI